LRCEKDLGAHVKSDVYSHISEVLSRIIKYHPYDALDKFEEISCLVKKINVKHNDPDYGGVVNDKANTAEAIKITNNEALQLIEKAKKLLQEDVQIAATKIDSKLLTTDVKFIIPNL
tara:strand:- start:768 stop:1118 length:351 start_codon:yes stop_codon:yes gene_type:complete